jgi:crotonobetainyl-CoA:carnitine CoA-transferase CaiB-like acyl-CoA transferase
MQDDFSKMVSEKSRYDWFTQAADLGWTFAPVEDPWAVAHGPQTQARGSMQDVDIDGRTIKVPGLPFRFDDLGAGADQEK